jgi:hypothetical protein
VITGHGMQGRAALVAARQQMQHQVLLQDWWQQQVGWVAACPVQAYWTQQELPVAHPSAHALLHWAAQGAGRTAACLRTPHATPAPQQQPLQQQQQVASLSPRPHPAKRLQLLPLLPLLMLFHQQLCSTLSSPSSCSKRSRSCKVVSTLVQQQQQKEGLSRSERRFTQLCWPGLVR